MKKIVLFALALAFVSFTSCNNKRAAEESIATEESAAAAAVSSTSENDSLPYEYFEEVPVPGPGQTDPSVAEVQEGKIPYVVDFSATWCGPCQKLKPYFKQYEETFKGQANFATVDIDEQPELAKSHNVEVVPTVIIFADKSMKQELYRVEGFAPREIEEALMDNI